MEIDALQSGMGFIMIFSETTREDASHLNLAVPLTYVDIKKFQSLGLKAPSMPAILRMYGSHTEKFSDSRFHKFHSTYAPNMKFVL